MICILEIYCSQERSTENDFSRLVSTLQLFFQFHMNLIIHETYTLPDFPIKVTAEMGIMLKQIMQSMFGIWARNLHLFVSKSNIIV